MKATIGLIVVSFAVSFAGCSGGGDGDGTGDSGAPTAPTLSAQATSSTTIQLDWSGSTDDRGVAGYRLYRGGAPYHDENGTTWVDAGLTPTTQYCYEVLAYDGAGNDSAMSAQQCATTLAAGGPNYTLNVTKDGTGSGAVTGTGISCGTDCTEPYASGTSVTLTATAASGSTFVSWTGCSSSSGNTCDVTMSADRTVTPTFNASTPAPPANVSATSITQTSAVLTWSDDATNETGYEIGSCSGSVIVGSDGTRTCNGTFTMLHRTGAGATSYALTGLSQFSTYGRFVRAYNTAGASAARGVLFTTLAASHRLTITRGGAGTGTVTSSPAGIACGTTCSASFAPGTEVTLTATAAAGSTFAGWAAGAGCDVILLSGGCRMTMSADKTVTPTFNVQPSTTITLQAIASNLLEWNSLDPKAANTANPNVQPAVGLTSMWTLAGYPSLLAFASLVKFNVSSLNGKTIEAATLELTANSTPVGQYPQPFMVAAVNEAWAASTVTWNQFATFTYYGAQSFAYPTYVRREYAIDVKSIVQGWASGSKPNNGLEIMSTSYTNHGNVTSFDNYGFYIPTLTVRYR